jgi:hypothetical protein
MLCGFKNNRLVMFTVNQTSGPLLEAIWGSGISCMTTSEHIGHRDHARGRAAPVRGMRVCPMCFRPGLVRAPRESYAHRFFVIAPHVRCPHCGTITPAPSSLWLCAGVALAAVALFVAALLWYVLPAVRDLAHGIRIVRSCLLLAVGLAGMVGFVGAAYVAARTALHTRWYGQRIRTSAPGECPTE